jgi:hypothetical protein
MAETTTKKTQGMRDVDDPIRQGRTNEDVVAVASVRKDGTPDQSPGFEFLNPTLGAKILKAQQADVKDQDRDHVAMVREEARDALRAEG